MTFRDVYITCLVPLAFVSQEFPICCSRLIANVMTTMPLQDPVWRSAWGEEGGVHAGLHLASGL